MKKMKPVLLLLVLVATTAWGLSLPEDDLVFDDVVEDTPTSSVQPETTKSSSHQHKPTKKWQKVEKLLGLPDAVAAVGHVFKLHIPKQAFSGSIDYYKVQGINGKSLAHWLRWDEPASALYGVPAKKDVGRTRITIKAMGNQGDSAEDSFTIHVVPERREHVKYNDDKKRCSDEQDRIMLSILADTRYDSLRPRDKVNALENLAGFLGLPTNAISIQSEIGGEPAVSGGDVVLSGPGNVGRRREKHSTIVQWQIGCDGHFWPRQMEMVKQLSEQARDGTLSEVTQLRVYHWRVRSEPTDYARNRREVSGSGNGNSGNDDDEEDYEEEGDGDEYDDDYDSTESAPNPTSVDEHPHRHHHGQDMFTGEKDGELDNEDEIWANRERIGLDGTFNNFNLTSSTSTTPSTSTTDAETIPSSSTTTSTTTTTTTEEPSSTSTSTTEPPTSPSEPTSGSPPMSSESEEDSSSQSTEGTPSTSTTTTTETVYNASVETSPEPIPTNASTFTNLTQTVTINSNNVTSGTNVTIDSMTTNVDEDEEEEEALTTDQEFDNETDNEIDVMSTVQPIANATSESSTGPSSTTPFVGNFSEPVVTTSAEPNATFSVNVTGEEYPEVYAGAGSSTPSTTSYTWSENATDKGESLDPYDSMHVSVVSSTESTSTSTTTQSTTSSTTESTTTSTATPTPSTTEPTTSSTTPSTTTTTTTEATTTTTTTTTTTPSTTSIRINNRPEVRRRLKKISVTQGKPLSYTIPDDTFGDIEDGNTQQLRLMVTDNGAPLKPNNWLQFNEETREIYGLPLQDHYGSYFYEVVAMDSEGESVSSKLDINIQQHKQIRAVNHEFTVYLKFEKRSAFPTDVDWELKVMRSLAELYGDSDLGHITVRSVDISGDQASYTWTNDSLVRSSTCPREDIKNLLRVLVRDEKLEEPSADLEEVLSPEIKVKRVLYEGFEQCREIKETPQVNEYPVPRNQIDQLNATVGQLFVYKVPKDTFFDKEDGDTSSMRASLLTANRTEIPERNWLQFDSNNQEFYGVPLDQDVGQKTYQLVVKDKEGLEATDSLVAQVHHPQDMRHVVEFKMVLSAIYESFAHSAQKKRTFIQKLQKLYGDANSNAISILSVLPADGGTAVIWRNLTLPTDRCPTEDLARLRGVLIDENNKFTDELNNEFNNDYNNPDFSIIQITQTGTGACYAAKVKGIPDIPSVDDSTPLGARYDEYLITYILPGVIIAAMMMLAGLIACILYKKRRSGKMSISEKDDERQSFRSKGIPVIFQDELEEKPDPGNKSPIILKEEKPPLPPPEYQRAEDGADIPMLSKEGVEEPYQPPPPFATARDSNQRNRPKPTPTYRKPPPYVPP